MGYDSYSYKNTMLGKEIIYFIIQISENHLNKDDALIIANQLLNNCIISKVPYSPILDFQYNDDLYCFVVK
jgi:hypothetical protein